MSARRAATFLAALGALVMSSGIALMVTATPANAAVKVTFCHSTGSESNPWVEETTSVNAFYVGHVLKQHTSDIYPAISFEKKGETIDVPAQGDQSVLENNCGNEPEEPGDVEIAVDIEFTDPNCDNENTASYEVTGDVEDVQVSESAAPAPGQSVTVTATANEGYVFEGGEPTYSETHPFGEAESGCDEVVPPTCPEGTTNAGQEIPEGQTAEEFCDVVVEPPAVCDEGTDNAGQVIPEGQTAEEFCADPTVIVEPPVDEESPTTVVSTPTKTNTVTPTVVHAGLAGSAVENVRGEQGLALMVAGMVLLVAAGGLRMRGSRAAL